MVQNKDATSYAVKTFLTTAAEGVVKDVDKLPYDLVLASQSIDLWSLGVMVYKFETGQDLFNIDQQKDDLKSYEDMEKLACWDDKKMSVSIQKVKEFNTRRLLNILLSHDPKKRGTIEQALNHPYFTLDSSKMKENKPIIVKPNQFAINSHVIDLPENGKVDQTVATKVCEFVLHAAQNGFGEKQPAKGILVVVGSDEDFDAVGFCKVKHNKFEGRDCNIHEWMDLGDFILGCCGQDGSIFINGMNGNIIAECCIIDLSIRDADQTGGTGHMNASAAGMKGCLAIKCPEDSCLTDGQGKGDMKVFSGTKDPTHVPVEPVNPPAKIIMI